MCGFFSAIATRDGRLLFCEENSHENIIRRAKLRDTDVHVRHWVRVEVSPQGEGWGLVRVDETTVPAWWTTDAPAHEARVLDLAWRVRPAREVYGAAERQAWEAYEAAVHQAREAYGAAAKRPAWEAYGSAERQTREAYGSAERQALEAYRAAVSTIDGYQPRGEK